FRHISELIKMGADITVSGKTAVVNGVKQLQGANVTAFDLRGGAGLCLAGLVAEGKTVISDVAHIDRGYQSIEKELSALGAKIYRIGEQ
ncbi:MAG: UDP-N-acetylglucosamine 1-carboxyvinyltransferase, partial [Clostridia bacterium]